jgi:hypothetical protein
MVDLNLSQYPVKATYLSRGLTESDINSDLVMTIMRRFYQMTDQERIDLGLTDEMMTTTNLYRLVEDGRIQTQYMKKIEGLPAYDIRMDIDGDGLFHTLPHPISSDAHWIPEKPIDRYNPNTYKKAVKAQQNKLRANDLSKDPNPSDLKKAWWYIKGIALTEGAEALREIGEDLDNFFGVDLQDAQNFITQDVQENQQAIVLLEAAMANKGDLRNFEVLKGDLIMSKDGRVVKSDNAFFDLISSNEGFEGSFYDAAKGYLSGGKKGQFGKGSHRDYMQQAAKLVQEGRFATQQEAFDSLVNPTYMANAKQYGMNDPTIGHGFSINNKEAMNALVGKGYTIEGLLNGSEFLKMEDSIDVFLETILPEKQQFVQNLYGNINFKDAKNSYLHLALTDMAYVAGNGWIGNKTQFYQHLNNLISTGDKKFLGVWGEENKDTILGQMTMDANAQARKGQGGNSHRLEQNAFYIQSWFNGSKIWKQETTEE